MALIICPECAKQVSDRASVCPQCGYPISSGSGKYTNRYVAVQKAKPVKTRKLFVVLGLVAVLALGLMAGNWYLTVSNPENAQEKAYLEAAQHYYSEDYLDAIAHLETLGNYKNSAEMLLSCKYHLAYEAMQVFDWEKAATYLTGLNYESSEQMLVDCSFMMVLEESLLHRMEATSKESWDDRSLISTELAYLNEFRNADFFDMVLGMYADSYIRGLDKQLESLNYERTVSSQLGWNGGMVVRCEVLEFLYREYHFMEDNKDFVGTYINQLEYHQKWLDAMNAMEINGHKRVKDPVGNQSYVEYYFKNDTKYTSTQTFEVTFWKDKDRKQLLGTSSATVENIGPYGQYTVRIPVPATVQGDAYYFSWSNYYNEILIN